MSGAGSSSGLPHAGDLDPAIAGQLGELGRLWARSPDRPVISPGVLEHWDGLVRDWVASGVPLVVRKGGGVRGERLQHRSGRLIVVADNSPAQWAFSRACAGDRFTIADIERLLDADDIPFTFIAKTADQPKMTYRRTLSASDSVNKKGWKLCHIDGIGLKTRTPLVDLDLDVLVAHSVAFLSPSNHFLVPLAWAGLGEVPEFLEEIRDFEASRRT